MKPVSYTFTNETHWNVLIARKNMRRYVSICSSVGLLSRLSRWKTRSELCAALSHRPSSAVRAQFARFQSTVGIAFVRYSFSKPIYLPVRSPVTPKKRARNNWRLLHIRNNWLLKNYSSSPTKEGNSKRVFESARIPAPLARDNTLLIGWLFEVGNIFKFQICFFGTGEYFVLWSVFFWYSMINKLLWLL